MDLVPGVLQKFPSNRVPQVDSWLQLPPHPPRSQNPTFAVEERQAVPGASKHVAGPLYTLHSPPHTFWVCYVQ